MSSLRKPRQGNLLRSNIPIEGKPLQNWTRLRDRLTPVFFCSRLQIVIRGQKVMLDFDLAVLYEVPTKVLNQALKRNIERFPPDFMFQLTNRRMDRHDAVTNCDRIPKKA